MPPIMLLLFRDIISLFHYINAFRRGIITLITASRLGLLTAFSAT